MNADVAKQLNARNHFLEYVTFFFFNMIQKCLRINQEIRNRYINVFMYALNIPGYHSASLFDSSYMFLCLVYLESFGGCFYVLKLSILTARWLRETENRFEA